MRETYGQSGSQFTFEVLVHSYLNGESEDSAGPCQILIQSCRNTFEFCVQQTDATDCGLGTYEFQLDTENDPVIFEAGTPLAPGIPNPLTYSTPGGQWPVSYTSYWGV